MGFIKDAIKGQKSSFMMIALGTFALLVSFLDASIVVATYVLVGVMLILILAAHYLPPSDDGDANAAFEDILLMISFGLLALVCFTIYLGNGSFEQACFVPILVCGVPIIVGAIIGLVRGHDITADVLVAVAIVASIFIGEYTAAAEISIIMQIGGFLEQATVSHANANIALLSRKMPSVATLLTESGSQRVIAVEDVKVGQKLLVKPGDKFPVDGVVTEGRSSVDMSMLTGESVPCDVEVGSKVYAGTINMYGAVHMVAERVSSESSISRMVKLIEEADAGRSKIVRTADKWARYIVGVAFCVAVAVYLVTGEAVRAVTVLCVFCPCALILATPTAIMAAAGNMSRQGILVRDGGALERLASVDTYLVDKTGTLTEGQVKCNKVVSLDPSVGDDDLARVMSAVESSSEHPLGKAIAGHVASDAAVDSFEYVPGRGVSGLVSGRTVVAGNRQFLRERCPEGFDAVETKVSELESEGYLVVMAGIDGRTVGFAVLSDTLRDTSRYAMRHLRMFGFKRILLTGDSKNVAVRMKDDLKMDDLVWECMPSDKLRIVGNIDDRSRSCMIGDGVNDAPALKRASVGISMGGLGTSMAMESSDIVFMDDNLSKLPGLIRLSRRMMQTIHFGIAFSLVLNSLAMVLAVLGMIDPVGGALVHNIGSVIVIIAAAMLLRYKAWRTGRHKVRSRTGATDI